MALTNFETHTGEIVAGERLVIALNKVADSWADLAHAIRAEDAYASHVPESVKEDDLQRQLELAERIRSGKEPVGFWLWQRINAELTGECIPFLPKPRAA